LAVVRQAHLPGNYELYDEAANRLGPAVCKHCWESVGRQNSAGLNTVWVSSEGRPMVWWLCEGCTDALRGEGGGKIDYLRSTPGVIASPGL
jgi:hypothetical protein